MKNLRRHKWFLPILVGAVLLFLAGGLALIKRNPPLRQVSTKASEPAQETAAAVTGGEAASGLARWLVKKGNEDFLSGRLQYALRYWELAQRMDPLNPLADAKLKKGREELEARVEAEYVRGLYTFKFLHFEQAIRHWEQVMRLLGDPSHPKYREAQSGIFKAGEELEKGRL